jgi:hypothetical protein
MKKLLTVFFMFLAAGSLFATGKGETELGPEITGLSWDWDFYTDDNRGGSSSIEMSAAGEGAYHFTGTITTKYAYGFAGFFANAADAYTLEAVKKAKAFSFKVRADGNFYTGKMITTDVTDFGYHEKAFKSDKNEMTVVIFVKNLMQPGWAAYKKFNQAKATGLQFQTEFGGKAGKFDITMWDLKLYE